MTHRTTVRPQVLQLPTSAPLVRVTAGMGSVGQKTWNLRRPVTLLGSRRPAHIVLHDSDICEAHCVLVNTGSEIILKDLHTSEGTLLNGSRIDLSLVCDGDVIQIGTTKIQVAIQKPSHPNSEECNKVRSNEMPAYDPPCTLELEDQQRQWALEEPVELLGSLQDATVFLDHKDVSTRHAVIFRFCGSPAVFDLGSRFGLFVDDQRCSLTPLHHRDVLNVGPFNLRLWRSSGGSREEVLENAHESEFAIDSRLLDPVPAAPNGNGNAPVSLTRNLSTSWKSLNTWEARTDHLIDDTEGRRDSLAAWEEELEIKEAALRGKLHDLERFSEQIEGREQEVNAQADHNATLKRQLEAQATELQARIAELEKKEAELQKREMAITQRWSRLKVMTCKQCGARIQPG